MHVISTFASWHIYNYVYTVHNSLQSDDDDDDDDGGGGGGGDVMIYIMKDAAIKQRETNIINADAFLTSTSSSAKHVSHFESASFNSFTTTGFIKTATLQHFALVSTSSQVRKPYDFNSEGSHASKICGCTKDLATDMGIFHLFVVFFCCKKNRRSETPTLFGAIYKGFVAAFSRN